MTGSHVVSGVWRNSCQVVDQRLMRGTCGCSSSARLVLEQAARLRSRQIWLPTSGGDPRFRRSNHLAATALLTNVEEPAAGAMRLTSAWLREKSSEKKLRATKAAPARKRLSLTTAQIAPRKPCSALISSRSPTARMAEASKTSPAVAVNTMDLTIPAIAQPEPMFMECKPVPGSQNQPRR